MRKIKSQLLKTNRLQDFLPRYDFWIILALLFVFSSIFITTQIANAFVVKSESLKNLPPDTKALLEELAVVQKKFQNYISKLEENLHKTERLIEEKKKTLDYLRKKAELLNLTPEQLVIIEEYNKTIMGDVEFIEWIKQKITWYEILTTIMVAFIFFWLGKRRGKRSKDLIQ